MPDREEEQRREGSMGDVDVSTAPGVQTRELSSGQTGVRLSDMLLHLADEMREVKRRAKKDPHEEVLQVLDCDLEVGLTWTVEGTAGVKFWVFELGGSVSRESTQTITVKLQPVGQIPLMLATQPSGTELREEDILGRGLPDRED